MTLKQKFQNEIETESTASLNLGHVPSWGVLIFGEGQPHISDCFRARGADPWVRELIADEIKKLTVRLTQYETIKRFALLDHDLTFDGDDLTYTLKLKRRAIEERYRDIIAQLYEES